MNPQTMKSLNMLAFGVSAGSLAVAAVYAILRRCFGVEMPAAVTGYVLPVSTAAAVGYLTNWLAVQLLFRPYRPLLGISLFQGMIPRRKRDLAENLAREIPANLMPPERIMLRIRRKIRETMQGPELAARLHVMVTEYIRDAHRKQELTQRLAAILDTAGSTGLDAGLTPSNVRRFYRTYGSAFVKGKVLRNEALRAKILDELKEHVPGLIGEIRANMPALLAEYMRDNPFKGAVLSVFTGASGENLPWRRLEQAVRDRLSGQDADRQVEQKLAEFESRLEGYLVSPGLEADIAALKQNGEIAGTLTSLRDDLAGKLLEFLENELVWQVIREQIIPGVRVVLLLQLRRNKDALMSGLDLPGHIRKSILDLDPETVHKLVNDISGEELGMIQILGFILGGLAGSLLVFAQ